MLSDTDAETIQVQMQAVLSDMPPKIKQMIAERTDPKSRYSLRKVSTHFSAAVDGSPYFFETIYMRSTKHSVKLRIENTKMCYKRHGNNGCVIKMRDKPDKIIEGEDYMQRALDDLGIILKSPRVFVEAFDITGFGPGNGAEQLLAKLDTFRHQLNVMKSEIDGNCRQKEVVQIIRHFKPKVLEILELENYIGSTIKVDEIVETDQWQHLKELEGGVAKGIPIAKFLHLEKFSIKQFTLTKEIVEEIVQWIRERRSNFVKYKFGGKINSRLVTEWQNAVSQYQPSRKRIRIPGTDSYLLIKPVGRSVTFKRVGGEEDDSDCSSEEDNSDLSSDTDSNSNEEPLWSDGEDLDSSEDSSSSDDDSGGPDAFEDAIIRKHIPLAVRNFPMLADDEEAETIQVELQPVLSGMPSKIKQMIAEHTDAKSRCCLRKVSPHFRAAVDGSPYYIDWFYMSNTANSVSLCLNKTRIQYKLHGDNGCVIKMRGKPDKIIEGEGYMQRALDDLGIILKSPRIFVKLVDIQGFLPGNGAEELIAKLDTFRYQLNIERFTVVGECSQTVFLQILRHVTPGILKNLDLSDLFEIDQIVETDQWQNMKELFGGMVQGIPIAKFMHLDSFHIGDYELTEAIVEEIVQCILQRRSSTFQTYTFTGEENSRLVKNWQDAQRRPSRKRIPIPGTDSYLLIKAHSRKVTFTKKDDSDDSSEDEYDNRPHREVVDDSEDDDAFDERMARNLVERRERRRQRDAEFAFFLENGIGHGF